jgi:hypothetical protein
LNNLFPVPSCKIAFLLEKHRICRKNVPFYNPILLFFISLIILDTAH